MRALIQVLAVSRRGAAQPAITASKSRSLTTPNRSERTVRASRRGMWKRSSGRTPRARGPTPSMVGSSASSALGKIPAASALTRLAGVVRKRVYREGSDVTRGEVLFLIDPAPFKADFDSAKAALAKAEATLSQARLQEQRYRELVSDKAVSPGTP